MKVLPPGTILQLMYLRERLDLLKPGYFIEVGPGSGEITALLLELGWKGRSYDLDLITIERLHNRFHAEIKTGDYCAIHSNFLETCRDKHIADLIISCMVIEHLNEQEEAKYMQHCADILAKNGVQINLVPSNPDAWGIEDDIAGHYRRYTYASITNLGIRYGYELRHIAGLTFPISNLLMPISNCLVTRNERQNSQLAINERTKLSGRRKVMFKTHFPSLLTIILNRFTMYPFHLIQKFFSKSESSLVIYFEFIR